MALGKTHFSNSPEVIATGTGRIIARPQQQQDVRNKKALYTNPALTLEAEGDEDETHAAILRSKREEALVKEIKNVLLVDCHDIFLGLLTKDIKAMMPHVVVTTAHTVDEALEKMSAARKKAPASSDSTSTPTPTHGFDMIVVENRLRQSARLSKTACMPLCGASLVQRIAAEIKEASNANAKEATDTNTGTESNSNSSSRYPLVIGMSAYLKQDEKILTESGSDFVWGKPPPKMDSAFRDNLVMAVMHKRHRTNVQDLVQHTVP